MDDATAHKIRDLKLRILQVEKEIAATQHKAELGQWLRAGHASQMAKAAERERERLDSKLDDLKTKLAAMDPDAPVVTTAPVEELPAPKPKAAKKTAATKATAESKTAKKTTKK